MNLLDVWQRLCSSLNTIKVPLNSQLVSLLPEEMESVVFRNQFHKWKTTCDQLNFHLRKHTTETKYDEKRKSEYQKILQDEQQNSLSQQWWTNSEGSWTSTDYKLLIKNTDQIWEKERPSPHQEVLHRGKIGATPTDSVIRFFRSPQAPGAQSERSSRASRRSTYVFPNSELERNFLFWLLTPTFFS